MEDKQFNFNDLVEVMKILREPNGCPWDKEQTHESLKRYIIEETYEVLEAIDEKNYKLLCEELGDLLLQIVFHARIAEENNFFNINDVCNEVTKKMYFRHRHVFGNDKAENAEDVVDKWEKIKKEEKGITSYTESLKKIPKNLPALMRSFKVQQKASKAGFDWDNKEQVFEKINEEMNELKEACKNNDEANIKEEVGDLIFATVNLTRFLNVEPETSLNDATNKFISRFECMEQLITGDNLNMDELSLEVLDDYWNKAKRIQKNL